MIPSPSPGRPGKGLSHDRMKGRILKLTAILVLATCLQGGATGYAQKVTLQVRGMTLDRLFGQLRSQTGYQFLYADEVLRTARPVNLSVRNAELSDVLAECFRDQPVTYTISDRTIVVKRKVAASVSEPAMSPAVAETAREVRGRVTDAAGQPLQGVSVTVKGGSQGTQTDATGAYSISVPEEAVLVFSYVGYATVEQKVQGRSQMDVSLSPSQSKIDEVVVVGFGTQRRRDLTGSVSSVKGEEIEGMPATNPIASLQGRVPGLTISNTGRAGASPVVRIRGVNSTNSAGPVYVVDGILHDNIDFLNPADIESIDVLRDPSSIAIYGLRGANGVIAITSKKAARGQTRVSLQSSQGVQRVQDRIALADAAGFRKLYTAQLANIGAPAFDYTNYTANTDWQDLVLRDASFSNNNISISNSGEKTTTYLNLGYTDQEGVLRNDRFQRYLVRMNQEVRIRPNIKVGADLTGYHSRSNSPAASITNALWAAPIVPVQYSRDTFYSMPSFQRAQVGNPIAALNRGDGNAVDRSYRLIGTLFAEVRFLRHFTWRSAVYADLSFNNSRSFTRLPYSFMNLGEGSVPTNVTYDNSARTTVSQDQGESRRFQQDHTLTFDRRFGKGHSISTVAGLTTLYTAGSSLSGSRRDTAINIPNNPDFWYLGVVNPNNPLTNGGGGSESAIAGGFARVGYSYDNKYLLNATVRRDGSSKFAPENRWGTFGSVGVGWVLSEESFVESLGLFDFLKLRGAWGLTGNANGFADNLYRPGISNASTAIFGDNVYTSIQAAYIPDPNLHWEVVAGLDAGIDLRMLKDRLSASFTYYDRTTRDILTAVTLPNETRSYFTNLGEISNRGVEFNAEWSDRIGRDFTYRVSANFSHNRNLVNSIGDNFNFAITGNGGVNLTTTGKSIGYFYGYTQTGVYQTVAELAKRPSFVNSLPGDIAYADVNGDGLLTPADRGYIGTPFPPYSYGGSLSLGYHGLDFEVDLQGAAGHRIYAQRRTSTFAVLNYEANRLNAWTAAGSTNIEPILDNTRGNNFLMSTYFLEPGDYLRIRNLQLGYTLERKLLAGLGVRTARFYLNAQNPKTWSRVTGYSPEPLIGSILGGGADNGAYPVPAVYSIGVNLTF